jgi:hypothetical protein
LAIAVLFVIPAGVCGYQLINGIAGMAIGKGFALTLLSVAGGGFVASAAWRQLVSPSFTARRAERENGEMARSIS